MKQEFVMPCSDYYGCNPRGFILYASGTPEATFVRCNSCNLIWRDTSSSAREEDFGESYFRDKGYDKKMRRRIHHSHLFLSMLEQFVNRGEMLEVGPGLGEAMTAATERGWNVQGIDISMYVVELCRKRGLIVAQGSLSENCLPDNQFNAIFMKHVLEHYKDPFLAPQNARRLLKEGGFLQVIVPNADYLPAAILRGGHRFYRRDKEGSMHYIYFTCSTLKRMLEHAGFQVLQQKIPFFVTNPDSVLQNLEMMARKSLPFLGSAREIMMIAQKSGKD
jgi:2-polyprenyl-3-methyl-5-hydroxy-6-metoxy-1,4-benzoquinol methylase